MARSAVTQDGRVEALRWPMLITPPKKIFYQFKSDLKISNFQLLASDPGGKRIKTMGYLVHKRPLKSFLCLLPLAVRGSTPIGFISDFTSTCMLVDHLRLLHDIFFWGNY